MLGADCLWDIIQHFNGQKPIPAAQAGDIEAPIILGDLCDIKGQERGKRALEIAVAGRHHLFLVSTPGCGKSMLAKRSLGLLPPLTPTQALETSMIKSIFGELSNGGHVSHRFDRCIIPPRTRQLSEAGGMQNPAKSALPIMAFYS